MNKENNTEETMDSRFIEINGAKVLNLTPSFTGELALVSRNVLERLTAGLGKVSLSTIKYDLKTDISRCTSLEELVAVTQEFTDFHNSVNLIKTIKEEELQKIKDQQKPKVIGRIDMDGNLDDLGPLEDPRDYPEEATGED